MYDIVLKNIWEWARLALADEQTSLSVQKANYAVKWFADWIVGKRNVKIKKYEEVN